MTPRIATSPLSYYTFMYCLIHRQLLSHTPSAIITHTISYYHTHTLRKYHLHHQALCCCLPTSLILASGGGGWSPIFPLVVHQPSSPSIWPAGPSLRRGLSINPGVTTWCVCVCVVEEMMCVVYASVTKGA